MRSSLRERERGPGIVRVKRAVVAMSRKQNSKWVLIFVYVFLWLLSATLGK